MNDNWAQHLLPPVITLNVSVVGGSGTFDENITQNLNLNLKAFKKKKNQNTGT